MVAKECASPEDEVLRFRRGLQRHMRGKPACADQTGVVWSGCIGADIRAYTRVDAIRADEKIALRCRAIFEGGAHSLPIRHLDGTQLLPEVNGNRFPHCRLVQAALQRATTDDNALSQPFTRAIAHHTQSLALAAPHD